MKTTTAFWLIVCIGVLIEKGFADLDVIGEGCTFLPNKEICSIYGMKKVEVRSCTLFRSEMRCRKERVGRWARNINPNVLKVVSYNVRELPPLVNRGAERERTCRIPDAINKKFVDADVVVIQELFYKGCIESANMAALLRLYGYHWSYQPLDDKVSLPKLIGAGLLIASKYPIVKSSSFAFSTADWTTSDFLSKKGVIYAAVNKNGTVYHIFNTHLQSTDSDASQKARLEQVKEIKKFKDNLVIPVREAVIYAGDFNEPLNSKSGNLRKIMTILKAGMPNIKGNLRHTFNSKSELASGGGSNGWLDYFLISNANKTPKKAEMSAYKLEYLKPFKYCSFSLKVGFYAAPNSLLCSKAKTTKELSDHNPILGLFIY